MDKWTFQQVVDAHKHICSISRGRAHFQEQWTKVLLESGWTREEFHDAIDGYGRDLCR